MTDGNDKYLTYWPGLDGPFSDANGDGAATTVFDGEQEALDDAVSGMSGTGNKAYIIKVSGSCEGKPTLNVVAMVSPLVLRFSDGLLTSETK